MSDIPIIFSAPMIRALLADRKSLTRRLAWRLVPEQRQIGGDDEEATVWQRVRPGDRLWVREAWGINDYRYGGTHPIPKQRPDDLDDDHLSYLATESDAEIVSEMSYRPSIHMPRWASRLTLIVTAQRVERLQAISEADAIAEGMVFSDHGRDRYRRQSAGWHADPAEAERGADYCLLSARHAFGALWNSLHGPGAWAGNPEVAVISYRVVRANIDSVFSLAA